MFHAFYQLEFPTSVARAIQRQTGDKGSPRTMIVKVPVPNFSEQTYNDTLYGRGIALPFHNMMQDGDITKEEYKKIRVYEILETDNGVCIKKELAAQQDFRDATIVIKQETKLRK